MTSIRTGEDQALAQRLRSHGLDWIVPDWPAPANVRALMTTRNADIVDGSDGVRRSMNLGRATGDHAATVERNRALLASVTGVQPLWLSQTHGTNVAIVGEAGERKACGEACGEAGSAPRHPEADAAIATRPGIAATVRVADCMPVLFASRDGSVVGAAHAGWRGLCAGVLEATVAAMRNARMESGADARRVADAGRGHTAHLSIRTSAVRDDIVAWMGPAIGPQSFEVGDDVRQAFVDRDPSAQAAFTAYPGRPGKWLADLYALARMRLSSVGIDSIGGGDHCTVRDAGRFFSYRRDGSVERMAALIWLEREA